jgi:hypothetical protein
MVRVAIQANTEGGSRYRPSQTEITVSRKQKVQACEAIHAVSDA